MGRVRSAVGVAGLMISLVGCDATIELTKAPFDASTALSNGVTQATSELVQPTTEFTSSTTPGAEGVNSPARARKKLELFAAYSYEHLRSDLARGDGEYVTSLAALAGVPDSGLGEFRVQMRNDYAVLFEENISARESAGRIVDVAWSAGHGRAGIGGH